MSTIKDNTIFDKTSFLEGSNSEFIEELYLKYISNPDAVPQSWRKFFEGLNDDNKVIENQIKGPSWSPKKNDINKIINDTKVLTQDDHHVSCATSAEIVPAPTDPGTLSDKIVIDKSGDQRTSLSCTIKG